MSKPGSRLWPGALIAAAVMAVTLLLGVAGALDAFENIGYDWRMKSLRSDAKAPDEIAVVLIDDASLAAMNPLVGRWPWPRSVHADVIDFLKLGGARAIVFDLLFTENEAAAESDARLVEATTAAGTVIHAMQLYRDSEDEHNTTLLNRPISDAALQFSVDERDHAPSLNSNYYLPLPDLIKGALGLGVVNVDADSDGVYRRSQLYQSYQGHRFATLGSAPLVFADAQSALLQRDEPEQLVNYYGHINTYSIGGILAAAQKVMAGELDHLPIDPYEFENKIVFIGASAAGLEDLKATPLSGAVPGVMIHASLAGNLLRNELLHRSSVTTVVMITLLMTLLICAMVLYFKGLVLKVSAPVVLAALYVWLCFFTFRYNYVMAMAPVLVAISLSAIGCSGYLLFSEGRDKRRVRAMLAQYVSPAVLNTVVDHYQDHMEAEVGSEEEISILFSDIRGFTALSEAVSATKVVEMLNHYFSAMTAVIFDKRGTVDKFIGDAIMAFWGAPIREARHADLALEAAIEMCRRLEDVNRWLQENGYPTIKIGIGINSGKVILGNIGSVQKLDYTVIGDNVNLASRLEGATKQYGVAIVISEQTHERLQAAPPCYLLDLVRVKGKHVPIRIYSPIIDHEVEEAQRLAQLSHDGFDAYLHQQWDIAIELYSQLPEMELRSLFIERCRHYQQQPPVAEWDGVFTMTSK